MNTTTTATKTYTVTVQKRLTLHQTYTLTAASEQEARRRAREHASEVNAVTSQTDWRVTTVEIDASAEEVTDVATAQQDEDDFVWASGFEADDY